MTYNPVKNKVYALLKDKAKSDDILKAAFHVSQLKVSFFFVWWSGCLSSFVILA